jgi:hypothetical protein
MSLKSVVGSLRRVRVVNAIILLGLAFYSLSLTLFPRIWNHWPLRSHYHYDNKGLLWPLGWNALPLALTLAGLLALTWKRRKATLATLLLLFACAVSLQWALSFLDGLNARRLSSTLLAQPYGHSEFVRRAYEEHQPLELARRYEARCAAAEPRSYIQTKPPGQLLFYSMTAELYRVLPVQAPCKWLAAHAGFEQRDPFTGLAAFTTILFSIVSCLPVVVLSWLGARLEENGNGLYYGLVFLLCPASTLVTMHLDQVLYPLLVSLALLAALLALHKHVAFGALAAGFVYSSIYVSFSLAFLVPTIGLWWAVHFCLRPDLRRKILLAGLSFALGALTCYAAFRWGLGFEIAHAYRRAMEHHAAWRDTAGLVGASGSLRNFVEAAFWLGVPAAVLCGAQWLRSARAVLRGSAEPFAVFVLLYPLIVLAVSTFGHSTREIGRLWIPLLIPAQLAAAREMNQVYRERPTAFILFSSLAILLRKSYHDFR